MKLTIYLNPTELAPVQPSPNDIYIVIDVMRATTTMTVLFEQGARQVLAALSIEQAREAGEKIPGRLLCGERHTITPPGFDWGNSPAQFAQQDLHGRDLILTTSNGTRALFACPEHSMRLAGCFYNGTAVCTKALNLAEERESSIAIVCAAEYGYFALEDTACAGYLASELLKQKPDLQINDSVRGAITIYEQYPAEQLIIQAQSALDLIAINHHDDLEYCLRKNGSTRVPMVSGIEAATGLLTLSCPSAEPVEATYQ